MAALSFNDFARDPNRLPGFVEDVAGIAVEQSDFTTEKGDPKYQAILLSRSNRKEGDPFYKAAFYNGYPAPGKILVPTSAFGQLVKDLEAIGIRYEGEIHSQHEDLVTIVNQAISGRRIRFNTVEGYLPVRQDGSLNEDYPIKRYKQPTELLDGSLSASEVAELESAAIAAYEDFKSKRSAKEPVAKEAD